MRPVYPASLEQASRSFPKLVLLLAQNKLVVTIDPPNVDHPTVLLECPQESLQMRILASDFDLIRGVCSQFTPVLSIFPSEPSESILDRARALIRVEFAGRGAF